MEIRFLAQLFAAGLEAGIAGSKRWETATELEKRVFNAGIRYGEELRRKEASPCR